MFTLLAILSGAISAITVAQNGQLADFYGDYSAAVIVHLAGLVTVLAWRFFKRKTLPQKQYTAPWKYLGGVVGVATLVFTSMAYGGVSVTAITGLGLLGQSLTSVAVDHLGLFGAQKSPFYKGKLLGLVAVFLGAAVMVLPMDGAAVLAVVLALASGATIVISRTINAQLAKVQGPMRSTVMNYVTGLTGTFALMLLLGRSEPLWTAPAISSNWFMYLGGSFGVMLIMLLNLTVNRVPSLAMTLLQFTGQIFTSLLLDLLLMGGFSWQSAVGGALVALGLCLNSWMDMRRTRQAVAS